MKYTKNDKHYKIGPVNVSEYNRTKTKKRLIDGATVTKTITAKKMSNPIEQTLDQSGTKRKVVVSKSGAVKKDKTSILSKLRLNNLI